MPRPVCAFPDWDEGLGLKCCVVPAPLLRVGQDRHNLVQALHLDFRQTAQLFVRTLVRMY
jgi:hypothetical protein